MSETPTPERRVEETERVEESTRVEAPVETESELDEDKRDPKPSDDGERDASAVSAEGRENADESGERDDDAAE